MERLFTTVVSGLPRSGTSMMMQMLEAGGMDAMIDHHRPPDADNPRGYYEYEPVRRTRVDASWAAGARGRAVKVVHLLLSSLPKALDCRVVWMRRDLREVVASQRAMLARQGGRGADLSDERLIEVFRKQVEQVERALTNRPSMHVLRVEHGRTISQPEVVAGELSAFLGGGLDTSAMAAVVDGTLYRQRRG